MRFIISTILFGFNVLLMIYGINNICEDQASILLKGSFIILSLFSIVYSIFQTVRGFSYLEEYQNHMETRCCKNCVHSVPNMAKDRSIHCYCDLSPQGVDNYPVLPYERCGHFDYTEELKTEQVRIQAEKMLKVNNKKGEQYD